MKQESQASGSAGMITELFDAFGHEGQRMVNYLVPSYPFISDEELAARISARLRATRSSSIVKVHRMLGDFHRVTLSNIFEITLSSGERVNSETMYDLLKDLSLVRESRDGVNGDAAADAEKYLHSALSNLMLRYGSPVLPDHFKIRDEQNKAFLDAANLDTMKRVAQLHLSSLNGLLGVSGKNKYDPRSHLRILNVTVKQARNLPQMDLGKGVDVFCALFVEGAPGLFQTEILRGKSEEDWVWREDATFEWEFGPQENAEEDDRKLVVMVYDKDQISSDDLIGCVTVKLRELQNGPLDVWREIVRPKRQFYERKRGLEKPELRLSMGFTMQSDQVFTAESGSEMNGYQKQDRLGMGRITESAGSGLSAAVWSGSEYASSSSLVLCPPHASTSAYLKNG